MNDDFDHGKDKRNEGDYRYDTDVNGPEESDTKISSESEGLFLQTQDQQNNNGDFDVNQHTWTEAGPEISQFLKTEDYSDAPQKESLDSASVVHSVGHVLRNTRMAKNMSVDDVSRQLRISVQQVEAIEKESFDELPGRTFVRGFVRNYANLLQLDAAAIVQLLPGPAAATVAPIEHTPFKIQEMTASSRDGRKPNSILLAVIVLAFLIFAGYFLYKKMPFWQQSEQYKSPAVQQEDGQASIELKLPVSSLNSPDEARGDAQFNQSPLTTLGAAKAWNTIGTLTFNFTADAHVKVTDGNDEIVFDQNNIRGTYQRISGKKPLSIVISDASAAEVTYNDRLIDIEPYANTQNGSAQFTLE